MPSPLTADPALITPGEWLDAFGPLFASAFQEQAARITSTTSHSSTNRSEQEHT